MNITELYNKLLDYPSIELKFKPRVIIGKAPEQVEDEEEIERVDRIQVYGLKFTTSTIRYIGIDKSNTSDLAFVTAQMFLDYPAFTDYQKKIHSHFYTPVFRSVTQLPIQEIMGLPVSFYAVFLSTKEEIIELLRILRKER